jgi:hypothetical protein
MPVFVPPIIAFCVFLLLGIVTWSYRDVANRHSDRVDAANAAAGTDSHAAGH